jgi:hypothetical protein
MVEPKRVLKEEANNGAVICACGQEFNYDLAKELNMAEWYGYIVPVCPACNMVPTSASRRMDL